MDILVFKKYGFAGHFSHQPCPFFPSFVSQKQHLFFSGPQLRGPRKCKRGGTNGKIDRCFFAKPHVMSDVLIYHHMMVFFLCCQFHLKLIKKVHGTSAQDFSKKTRRVFNSEKEPNWHPWWRPRPGRRPEGKAPEVFDIFVGYKHDIDLHK